MNVSSTRYTKVAVFLHWLIGLSILGMFAFGWYMTGLPKDAPKTDTFDLFNLGIYTLHLSAPVSPRTLYFNLHKSIGVTLLALIVLRIIWRFIHKPPAPLDSWKAWERRLSGLSHKALYLMMIVVPLSGVIMSAYGKYAVKWFGIVLIEGMDSKPVRELFLSVHQFGGWILLAFIVLHIVGALKHWIIDKDETMRRMSWRQ
ncbi:MAG TPA: cytochrome b [Methylophilaceae bacterium]|nr:cytochrome b [Methylophilaceae bacterium]